MNLGQFNVPDSPVVMGILDLTADSYYEGAAHTNVEKAVARGEQMMREGAALIDIGGESMHPGATKLSVQEELDRVIPVIEFLSKRLAITLSVNTSNPEVMQAAINAGAKMVNDIRALTKPGALQLVAKLGVPVCLMHMHNDPAAMQIAPKYNDMVTEVYKFLDERIQACINAGIESKKIIVDPGFGFGKNLQLNIVLLRALRIFKRLDHALLVGISNKSMIGQILDATKEQRVYGSVAAAIIAVSNGADIIRAHDVQATVDAIKVFKAVVGT